MEELIIDDNYVHDGVLELLAPLAGSLEFISAMVPPPYHYEGPFTEAGVQSAIAAFAERGGAPEIKIR